MRALPGAALIHTSGPCARLAFRTLGAPRVFDPVWAPGGRGSAISAQLIAVLGCIFDLGGWLRYMVFLARPVSKVDQSTSLRAKRPVGIVVPPGRFTANRTLHPEPPVHSVHNRPRTA